MSFLPYAKQSITEDDIAAVSNALRAEHITRGPLVAEFEEAVASYCDVRYAVSFNSGSTALRAACFAAEVSAGDRFLTTPNSFAATTISGTSCGGIPVFIDIDPTTGNLDLQHLKATLDECLTRGRNILMPVHYAGIPVDIRRMNAMIREPKAMIIEDGAAALGSEYEQGHRVGSCAWSNMTVFSFHPAKLITTGEGGLVTTNDAALDHRLRAYRNNGIEKDPERLSENPGPWYYEVTNMAGNYNFTDFQAALGLSQLHRINSFIAHRRKVISWYQEYLGSDSPATLLPSLSQPGVSPHLAVVRIDFEACGITRAEVMRRLKEQGIGSQVHYIPIYSHPFFQKISGNLAEYFPGMETFYSQALSLPLYVTLTEDDVKRVCLTLKGILTTKPSKRQSTSRGSHARTN